MTALEEDVIGKNVVKIIANYEQNGYRLEHIGINAFNNKYFLLFRK